jgi:hypothetical protein
MQNAGSSSRASTRASSSGNRSTASGSTASHKLTSAARVTSIRCSRNSIHPLKHHDLENQPSPHAVTQANPLQHNGIRLDYFRSK